MVITRIRRGAVRTKILIKNNLNSLLNRRFAGTTPRFEARHLALGLLMTRIVFAPVPVAVAAEVTPATGDADIPPSTVATVAFSPTAAETLTISEPTLASITAGKSLATEAEEAAAAKKAAEEEAARQEAAKKAAAEKAAEQARAAAAVSYSGDVADAVRQAATAA